MSEAWKNAVLLDRQIHKIFELRKGAKLPQCDSNFMNKIGRRSNTAHPPTAPNYFWFSIVW